MTNAVSVLLIDDDEDVLDTMGDLVRLLGGSCVALSGFAELLERREEALRCALAIVDVNLGADEPSGLDVYTWLRAARFPGRVMFLSGYADNHPFVERARALVGARVVQKPLGLAQLCAALKSHRLDSIA